MNRLILLGNGFDLAHGLKTSYSDFMLDLLKTNLQHFFTDCDVDHFSETYTYKNGPITVFKKGGNHISQESRDSVPRITTYLELKDFLRRFNISIHSTSSLSIFGHTYSHLENFNWADVEAIYYDILLSIVDKNNVRKLSAGAKGQIEKLNQELDFFKDKLVNYLLRVQEDADLSKGLDKKAFWERILGASDSFLPRRTQILNFNYTSTILNYGSLPNEIDGRQIYVQVNNIHGRLEDSDSIIFGYGDEVDSFYKKMEDLNDNEVLRHAKSFGYFKNSNYQTLLGFLEDGKFEVWLIGHSCGLSDRVMLKKIFEHSRCNHIKVYHYSRGGGNDHVEKTQQISRHFKDKELMRERIKHFDPSDCITELLGGKIVKA